jgi:uncharacterized phage protein (TIGR01671 family)
MREINFRAWDDKNKKMLHNVATGTQTLFGDAGEGKAELQDCYLMQYTGLKDKNGKEIYEGDVVEFHNIDTSVPVHRLPVVWRDDAAGFVCSNDKVSRGVDMAAGYDTIHGEVIGNIYENPNLLDKA